MHTHTGGATKGSNGKRVNYIDTKRTNPSQDPTKKIKVNFLRT